MARVTGLVNTATPPQRYMPKDRARLILLAFVLWIGLSVPTPAQTPRPTTSIVVHVTGTGAWPPRLDVALRAVLTDMGRFIVVDRAELGQHALMVRVTPTMEREAPDAYAVSAVFVANLQEKGLLFLDDGLWVVAPGAVHTTAAEIALMARDAYLKK